MFKNNFEVLKEINDKKKVLVISDKPKVKKPKTEKPAQPEPATAAKVPAAQPVAKKVTAAAPAKVAAKPAVDEPPKNSLQAHKEAMKRAAAEAEAAKAAKAAAVVEAPAVVEATPEVEAPAATEGEAAAAEAPAVAPVAPAAPVEAPKLTLEEYHRLRDSKRFVAGEKQLRRVDPTNFHGFEELKQPAIPKPVVKKVELVKKVEPVKKEAPKVAAGKGAKAPIAAIPAAVPAPKTLPKEKKEKEFTLGEFLQQEVPTRGGRGGYRGRGGLRGGRGGAVAEKDFDLEKLHFPSL